MGNTLTVHNIELSLLKGRCHLIFHNLYPGTAANHIVTILQGINATYIQAHGGIEFQGTATGSGFGVAKHNAHLFTDLVNEDGSAFRFRNKTGQLTQGLAHQTRL